MRLSENVDLMTFCWCIRMRKGILFLQSLHNVGAIHKIYVQVVKYATDAISIHVWDDFKQ